MCRRPVVIVKGKLSMMKRFCFAFDEDTHEAFVGEETKRDPVWIFRFTKFYLDTTPYVKIVAFVGKTSCNWCEESVNEKLPDVNLLSY